MYVDLMKKVGGWSDVNFPKDTAIVKFTGICEELGELTKATSPEEELDAIADMGIYTLDFCYKLNIDLDHALFLYSDLKTTTGWIGAMGPYLTKFSQGIKEHLYSKMLLNLTVGVVELFRFLESRCKLHAVPLQQLIEQTFYNHVAKRNWKDNPETGEVSNVVDLSNINLDGGN